ncbi:hypothetical protein ACLB1Q_29815 [Escherichia coli]
MNGAIAYAQAMIDSGMYSEVIAIGVAGDDEKNVEIRVYLVFGSHDEGVKYIKNVKTFGFLANNTAFDNFYANARLTELEIHRGSRLTVKKNCQSMPRNSINSCIIIILLHLSGYCMCRECYWQCRRSEGRAVKLL